VAAVVGATGIATDVDGGPPFVGEAVAFAAAHRHLALGEVVAVGAVGIDRLGLSVELRAAALWLTSVACALLGLRVAVSGFVRWAPGAFRRRRCGGRTASEGAEERRCQRDAWAR